MILPLGKGAVQAVLVRKPSFNWMSFTTNLAELHDKSTPPRINGWNPKIGGLGRCFSFSVLRYFQVPCWCFIGCRSFELTHPFKRMYGELPQHTLWFLGSYIICNIMSMICISYVNIYIYRYSVYRYIHVVFSFLSEQIVGTVEVSSSYHSGRRPMPTSCHCAFTGHRVGLTPPIHLNP